MGAGDDRAGAPGGRKPAELDREEENHEDAEQETGHGDSEGREGHADLVDQAALADRGDHPDRNG